MAKNYILCFFLMVFSIFSSEVAAQQAPQSSLYMLNPFNYNPAYAGLDNSISITGMLRRQWVGLAGAPATQSVNAHLPIYYTSGAFGINLESDAVGVQKTNTMALSYAQHLQIGKNNILSVGMSGGLVQMAINGAEIRTPDGTYEGTGGAFNHKDNQLWLTNQTASTPTFHIGAYFQSENLSIGLAAQHILSPKLSYKAVEETNIQLLRTYFANIGMKFDLSSTISVKPSILVKTDTKALQVDLSAIVQYNDNIFLGTTFRGYNQQAKDAVVIIGGLKLNKKLSLAYAFDIGLSSLKPVNSGSHEIMLNYNLNKRIGAGKPERIINNPRFL